MNTWRVVASIIHFVPGAALMRTTPRAMAESCGVLPVAGSSLGAGGGSSRYCTPMSQVLPAGMFSASKPTGAPRKLMAGNCCGMPLSSMTLVNSFTASLDSTNKGEAT